MELQEREAVQELLKKIPEDKLEEAVGGMSERNKNILGAAGLFVLGAGLGIGGKLAWDKWGSKKKEEKGKGARGPHIISGGVDMQLGELIPELTKDGQELTAEILKGNDKFKAIYKQFLDENDITEKDCSIGAFMSLCSNAAEPRFKLKGVEAGK